MSANQGYKKLEPSQESGNPAATPFLKFAWPWVPYEKACLIIIVVLSWVYVFAEYMIFNQKLSNELQGLSDGYFGFKKVPNNINLTSFI